MPVAAPDEFEEIGVILGGAGVVFVDEDGEVHPIDTFALAPATVYDVKSGQADGAPDADLALQRWAEQQRTGTIASNVATFDWPGPGVGEENRSSRVAFAASANVGLAVATITDANLLAQQPQRYDLEMMFQNVRQGGAPSAITLDLAAEAAGRMPIRYAPGVTSLSVPFGSLAQADIEVHSNYAVVRALLLLGASVPALLSRLTLLADGNPITVLGANSTQIMSFNPDLVIADRVLTIAVRRAGGTAITLPSGKGYSSPDGNGLTSGLLTVSTLLGMRLGVSDARGADGAFGGTGAFSSANDIVTVALRGGVVHAYAALGNTGTTLSFPAFSDIPAGSKIYVAVTRGIENSIAQAPGGTTLYTRALAGVAFSLSWTEYTLAEGVTSWAPSDITQTSATWGVIAVVVRPGS